MAVSRRAPHALKPLPWSGGRSTEAAPRAQGLDWVRLGAWTAALALSLVVWAGVILAILALLS